jgi:hypothetical protein
MVLGRVVGAVADEGRLRSRDSQTSEALSYIAAGLIGRAELSYEQCCLVGFVYRSLWLPDRRCALDRTKEARLASDGASFEHRELALQECVLSSSPPD